MTIDQQRIVNAKENNKITGYLSKKETSLLSKLNKEIIALDNPDKLKKIADTIGQQKVNIPGENREITVLQYLKDFLTKNKDAIVSHMNNMDDYREVDDLEGIHGYGLGSLGEAFEPNSWVQLFLNARGDRQNHKAQAYNTQYTKPKRTYDSDYSSVKACECELVVDGIFGSHSASAMHEFMLREGIIDDASSQSLTKKNGKNKTNPSGGVDGVKNLSQLTSSQMDEIMNSAIKRIDQDFEVKNIKKITPEIIQSVINGLIRWNSGEYNQESKGAALPIIRFPSIMTIDEEVAKKFYDGVKDLKYEAGGLCFDGIKSISTEVLSYLAKSNISHLSLRGLTKITPSIAKELAKFSGRLYLSDTVTMDKESATILLPFIDKINIEDKIKRLASGKENGSKDENEKNNGLTIESLSIKSTEKGKATYYDSSFEGRKIASSERYDPKLFTAAHKTLPFGTIVEVKRPDNGKKVYVRINDRGPYIKGRSIELSMAASKQLGLDKDGIVDTEISTLQGPDGEVTGSNKDAEKLSKNAKHDKPKNSGGSSNEFKSKENGNKQSETNEKITDKGTAEMLKKFPKMSSEQAKKLAQIVEKFRETKKDWPDYKLNTNYGLGRSRTITDGIGFDGYRDKIIVPYDEFESIGIGPEDDPKNGYPRYYKEIVDMLNSLE